MFVRKKAREMFREMMGVDDKRLHPRRDQVIERESDERLLENRDERLGQLFRQRTKPQAEPGAEDEGLCNHLPNDGRDLGARFTALHRMRRVAMSNEPLRFRVAHASRVLVSVSHRNELFPGRGAR